MIHKSTCRAQKTAKSQQVKPESEDGDSSPTKEVTPVVSDNEDIYINEEEERALMRREEEEESEEDSEEMEKDQTNEEEEGEDSDESEIVQLVVPQKRKKGKDPKNPISKIFLTLYLYRILSK